MLVQQELEQSKDLLQQLRLPELAMSKEPQPEASSRQEPGQKRRVQSALQVQRERVPGEAEPF